VYIKFDCCEASTRIKYENSTKNGCFRMVPFVVVGVNTRYFLSKKEMDRSLYMWAATPRTSTITETRSKT
jgi:hypothetical protein